jgi:hypothetical protein
MGDNSVFLSKLLFKFPKIFRPMVKDFVNFSRPYFLPNDFTEFVKSLAAIEPGIFAKINNPYVKRKIIKTEKLFRKPLYYLISKSKQYMIPTSFIKFSKDLLNSTF